MGESNSSPPLTAEIIKKSNNLEFAEPKGIIALSAEDLYTIILVAAKTSQSDEMSSQLLSSCVKELVRRSEILSTLLNVENGRIQ